MPYFGGDDSDFGPNYGTPAPKEMAGLPDSDKQRPAPIGPIPDHRHYPVRCVAGPYWLAGDQILPAAEKINVDEEVTWSTVSGWIMKRERDMPFVGIVLFEAEQPMQRYATPKVGELTRPVHAAGRPSPKLRQLLEGFSYLRESGDVMILCLKDPTFQRELDKLHADIFNVIAPNADAFELESLLIRCKVLRDRLDP